MIRLLYLIDKLPIIINILSKDISLKLEEFLTSLEKLLL
jgi:hypothetical protein